MVELFLKEKKKIEKIKNSFLKRGKNVLFVNAPKERT